MRFLGPSCVSHPGRLQILGAIIASVSGVFCIFTPLSCSVVSESLDRIRSRLTNAIDGVDPVKLAAVFAAGVSVVGAF
jgi:hypothetical protein